MKEKLLHPIQKNLLKLLSENADDPLTIRQLMEELDVSSTSVVAHHMQQLEKKGYIKRNPYNSKDYHISKGGPENPVVRLNLYGLATCGPEGSILDGDPIDRIPIASRMLSFPATEAFMVEAKGKSMEPKIHNGDWVIARRIHQPENGKVYVCVNNEEALIKRVQIDGGNVILHSFNQNVPPFVASPDFRVEGEVKGIISRKI